MSSVLVVEGRECGRLAAALRAEGLLVEVCEPSTELLGKAIGSFSPGAVILEVDTISTAACLMCTRAVDSTQAPVAIFAVRAVEHDVIEGFAAGAHNIFSEPIGQHELIARVRAVLRRAPSESIHARDVLVVGPIVLDRGMHQVTVAGTPVPLPRREFEIAEMLMRHAGVVVARRDLIRELWGAPRDTKSLDVQVGRLRARLASIEGVQRIVTVRGVGYRLLTEDTLADLRPEPPLATRS
jgi:two-component system response regulator RegX3